MAIEEPHKVSMVICTLCKYRWVAVRPEATELRQLQCPKCNQQGYVVETEQSATETLKMN